MMLCPAHTLFNTFYSGIAGNIQPVWSEHGCFFFPSEQQFSFWRLQTDNRESFNLLLTAFQTYSQLTSSAKPIKIKPTGASWTCAPFCSLENGFQYEITLEKNTVLFSQNCLYSLLSWQFDNAPLSFICCFTSNSNITSLKTKFKVVHPTSVKSQVRKGKKKKKISLEHLNFKRNQVS